MNAATPAVDFIAALDAPLRVVRGDFRRWAPTMSVLALGSAVAQIPFQFLFSAWSDQLKSGTLPTVGGFVTAVILLVLVGLPVMLICVAAEAICIADVTANRPVGVWSSVRPTFRWKYAVALTISGAISTVALLTCCVGGFLLIVPFAFIVPAAVEEGLGWDAVRRSMELARMPTGPAWYDRPGWKVLALSVAAMVLSAAANAIVQLPLTASTGWRVYHAISSGNIDQLQALGADPWSTSLGLLLGAGVRMFSSTYSWSGLFLIFRDARERLDGRLLEAAIAGTPT